MAEVYATIAIGGAFLGFVLKKWWSTENKQDEREEKKKEIDEEYNQVYPNHSRHLKFSAKLDGITISDQVYSHNFSGEKIVQFYHSTKYKFQDYILFKTDTNLMFKCHLAAKLPKSIIVECITANWSEIAFQERTYYCDKSIVEFKSLLKQLSSTFEKYDHLTNNRCTFTRRLMNTLLQ